MSLGPRMREDLLWCFTHPPLLDLSEEDPRFVSTAWWAARLQNARPWLTALDDDALGETWRARPPSPRLGLYFEHLLRQWLASGVEYELLAHGLVIKDGRRTVGEVDFLVRAPNLETVEHWEVAVKFYLGHPGDGTPRWFGPNARDRLDLKLAKMQGQQLDLLSTDPGREALAQLGCPPRARARGLLQGRLYQALAREFRIEAHQFAHPDNRLGWWVHFGDRARILEVAEDRGAEGWAVLPKLQWLAPAHRSGADIDALLAASGLAPQRPHHIALMKRSECGAWSECSRGFIVPDRWPRI